MDPVLEIKARLPIEELVGQYCQITKKGKQLKCICPFHNDSHPSMLISPEKGIAYCFACNSGGDVFSFYEKIEGVDFRQALKDLSEKAGVELPKESTQAPRVDKDEKERMRDCLNDVCTFYQEQLKVNEKGSAYLAERNISEDQIQEFRLGVSPDSFTATYDYLLKKGYSKSEIVGAGLAIQKELDGKTYDRFRNRLMFPITDVQGRLVGFGGRTLADDDAKYINSAEGPLYHKSSILYGLDKAKESMRDAKSVIMVEGYFDVLACHKVGVKNVVAVSGTALTEEHVKILKRTVDTVVLCLDQDQAGRQAAERAFQLCSTEDLRVKIANVGTKDPDEAVNEDPEAFKALLTGELQPYLDVVLDDLKKSDVQSIDGKRDALERLMPLLNSISSSVVKEHYMSAAAGLFGVTTQTLKEDLERFASSQFVPVPKKEPENTKNKELNFSKVDIALGTFLLYPKFLNLLEQIIEPTEDGFAKSLYLALKSAPETDKLTVEMLDLNEHDAQRAKILEMYCEQFDFGDWSDVVAMMNIKKQCTFANQEMIRKKSLETISKLRQANSDGKVADLEQLNTTMKQELHLRKMSE